MAKIKRANKFAIVPVTICSDPDISHVALRVYAALKSFANRDDGEAWPSQELLADRASLSSPESLRRPLKLLEEKGWIRKTRKGRPGRTRQFVVYEKPHNGADNDYASTEHLVDSCRAQCTSSTDQLTDHVTDQATHTIITDDASFIATDIDITFGASLSKSASNRKTKTSNRSTTAPFSEREFSDEIQRICNGQQPGMYNQLASNSFYTEYGTKLKNIDDLCSYLEAKKSRGR